MASARNHLRKTLSKPTLRFALALAATSLVLPPALAKPKARTQVETSAALGCKATFGKLTPAGRTNALRKTFDSSVELEMPMSALVIRLLTTTDGTVAPLLRDAPPPAWLEAMLNPGRSAKEIPWDDLSDDEKWWLLRHQAEHRTATFEQDRRIHGIKVREKLKLGFDQPTDFLGKVYPKGTHEIDVSAVLGKVEYMDPLGMKEVSGVELHFRDNFAAGKVSQDASEFQRGFQRAAGYTDPPAGPQHEHIVGRLPKRYLRAQPTLGALQMGELFRRTNLLFEVLSNLQKISMVSVKEGGFVYFDSLKAPVLEGATNYFYIVGKGVDHAINDDYKMALVGMRGSDKFDQPNLWGQEVRAIGGKVAGTDFMVEALNAVQKKMDVPEPAVDAGQMQRWYDKMTARRKRLPSPGTLLASAWHDRGGNARDIITAMPRSLRALATPKVAEILETSKLRAQLSILFFDWSKDPLFFEAPEKLTRIRNAQAAALEALDRRGTLDVLVKDISRTFLRDSGIAEEIFRDFGLDLDPRWFENNL